MSIAMHQRTLGDSTPRPALLDVRRPDPCLGDDEVDQSAGGGGAADGAGI